MAKLFTWCLKRTLILTHRSMAQQRPLLVIERNDAIVHSRCLTNPRRKPINVDYDEPKAFREFADEAKFGYTSSVETLVKILSIARANARKAIEEYPSLALLPKKTICDNFKFLREEGIFKSTIKDHKYLLVGDTASLMKKLAILKDIGLDPNEAAPLFHLQAEELANFQRTCKLDADYMQACNRIVYLAEKFRCDVMTICKVMSYNPMMLKLPAPKLLAVTEYILGIGMAPEHILNDVIIYTYNIVTIKERVERAERAGVSPLKPWVVRCNDSVWERVEEKKADRESILAPGQSIAEHLRGIFDCEMDTVDFVLSKHPEIRDMDLDNLTKKAKLLRTAGYRMEDVQRTPRVMNRSYKNILERLSRWKEVCEKPPPLFTLTLGPKRFDAAVEAARSVNADEKTSR